MNTLKKENIENQLFYLSKESLKYLVLNSRCGITLPSKELSKNIPKNDINTFKHISPLLCTYKKGSCKLKSSDSKMSLDEKKFNKEINIFANALMTLSLLEACDYYQKIRAYDQSKEIWCKTYFNICKNQLEFYAANLRNKDGVFVDKIDTSDTVFGDYKLEDLKNKFSFSDHALMMSAYYYYSSLSNDEESAEFRTFSDDILNMLLQFREELYSVSLDELSKLCLGLNLYFKYSSNPEAKVLLLDLMELLQEKLVQHQTEKLDPVCISYVDFSLCYKSTSIIKYKDACMDLGEKLSNLYNSEKKMFVKKPEKKSITFYCTEVLLYYICMLNYSSMLKDDKNLELMLIDLFRHQVTGSGIIPSWPDAPDLNVPERYCNFSLKAEDLLEEENFRLPAMPTPENVQMAPVFLKHVEYNIKKDEYESPRSSFDTNKDFLIILLILVTLKDGHMSRLMKTPKAPFQPEQTASSQAPL